MNKLTTLLTVFLFLAMGPCRPAVAEEVEFATGEYPPYISESLPGQGVVTQVVAEACRRAGITPVIRFYPWARAYAMVRSGQAKVSYFWVETGERKAEVQFGRQHVQLGSTAVFYRKSRFPDGLSFSTYGDLDLYRVVGVKGYWYESDFNLVGRTDVHYVAAEESALKILDSGRADVYVSDMATGIYLAHEVLEEKASDISYTLMHESPRKGYMIFHQAGTGQLRARLDRALQSMHADGTFERLMGYEKRLPAMGKKR